MRIAPSFAALPFLALATSCAEPPTSGRDFVIPAFVSAGESDHFVSPLSGGEEVPAVNTRARGNAVLTLSDDGTVLHYKLIVANIDNVTQSHIHLAPAGSNGPVVVFLYGFNPAGISTNGILAEGDITAANLIARAAIGFGATMPELVAALRNGTAYVNVHTMAFPPGEIRGQVKETGPTR